ncbi:MAG: response regulator transcription factor [Lachnospiraceae bacterium]|nr:response regulator transcription factor [Butyrivibrio sp.]MCM1344433.1 response regulator transcription factor [Muribaculaceae bacterium]MCM1411829.1 response regulator transcription factor [Lachnospiraceae bacterium]
MATILIVEDNENILLLTSARLKPYYSVLTAGDGKEALDIFYRQHVDLIVADIMMPDMDGYELVRCLREYKQNVPVIFVTAKSSFDDKRKGFASGIDDYMTKPINYEELLWRIEALLRRANINASQRIMIGSVTIDSASYTVSRGEERIELPKKEFELLFKFLSYPNMIFTKNQLLEDIWGLETDSDDSTIKTHINRLRNKFGDWDEFQIVTVRGLGYKLELQDRS